MPPPVVPSNNEIEADTLMERADKRANAFTFFGLAGSQQSKYEEAGEMCAKAGNLYKIEKKCLSTMTTSRWSHEHVYCMCVGKEAGDAYMKSAEYLMRTDDRDEAANKMVEASKCYKKSNPEGNFISE